MRSDRNPAPADRELAAGEPSAADYPSVAERLAAESQVLRCLKQLGVGYADGRVSPGGGEIAVGHPLGATGVRISLSPGRQLNPNGGRLETVSLCISIGRGREIVIERGAG